MQFKTAIYHHHIYALLFKTSPAPLYLSVCVLYSVTYVCVVYMLGSRLLYFIHSLTLRFICECKRSHDLLISFALWKTNYKKYYLSFACYVYLRALARIYTKLKSKQCSFACTPSNRTVHVHIQYTYMHTQSGN